jgi:hypothetical protein
MIFRTLTYLAFSGVILTSLVSATLVWNNGGSRFYVPVVVMAMLAIVEAPLIIFGWQNAIPSFCQLLFRKPRR